MYSRIQSVPLAPSAGRQGPIEVAHCHRSRLRGTPSAPVGRARGPRDASGYAVHGRVTPRHMTTVPSPLPFSSGIKVTPPAEPPPQSHCSIFSGWRDQTQGRCCSRTVSPRRREYQFRKIPGDAERLLRLHSRYGPPDRSAAKGPLSRGSSPAGPSGSSASGSIDNSPGALLRPKKDSGLIRPGPTGYVREPVQPLSQDQKRKPAVSFF
jgi:hypothetical protein